MIIRKKILPVITGLLALLLNSCSNTRFLTGDQVLYCGRKLEITGTEKGKTLKNAEKIAATVTYAQPNNSLMGKRVLPPVGLWVYNHRQTQPEKQEGFIYRKFHRKPVLISDINPDLRCRKIEADLFSAGFLNSAATFVIDSARNNNGKAKIIYHVRVDKPYRIARILNQPVRDSVDALVNRFTGLLDIKTGDIFNLENIRNGKSQLASFIVDEGYYFFSPEEIEIIADTTEAPYQTDLLVRKKPGIEPYIMKKYKIGKVRVRIPLSETDNSEQELPDSIIFDGLEITGRTNYLKPEIIAGAVLFRPNDLYTQSKHRQTLRLLNNFGVFQSVRMQFEVTDSLDQKMDVLAELLSKNDVTLNIEGAVQSKSTGFAGPVSEISIAHANLFRGANRLQLKTSGGFEWQWGKRSDSDISSNSFNAGINATLSFPKLIVPFRPVRENKALIGKTTGSLGFDFVNKTKYYQMNSLNIRFGYQWQQKQNISHQFFPLRANIVSLLQTTSTFDSIVNNNPFVKKSFEEQQIIGSEYNFTFDNTGRKRNGFYLQGMIGTSGNLTDALNQLGRAKRPYKLIGNVYSQFVKMSIDLRYYTNTVKEGLVLRFYTGTGLSYGNSSVMPYVEQYYSGGSNSLRGFIARSLGPGSYLPEEYNGIIDQTGDIKLEMNTEYRFRLTETMLGAFFAETGNVWLMNPDVARPGSTFRFNTFANQLAVGTGLGLRFDFNFFVLRTDFGFPLRNPYNDGNGNWNRPNEVFSNFRFNLAIGYPF